MAPLSQQQLTSRNERRGTSPPRLATSPRNTLVTTHGTTQIGHNFEKEVKRIEEKKDKGEVMPETKGRTLEEIADSWTERK
jgi:hypothetical protein